MKGKKLLIYICLTLLVIVLSFVSYLGFSNTEKTSMQNLAFGFIIIVELIFFAMIYTITDEKSTTFLRVGVISTSSIYLLITLILNIFLYSMFTTIRALISINIIALIIFIGVILIIFLLKKER